MWSPYFLYRVNDVKTGALIGEDKYGNKYFEDARYFFGKTDDTSLSTHTIDKDTHTHTHTQLQCIDNTLY